MSAAVAVRRTPWLPRFFTSESPFPWLLPASALMIVLGIYPLLYAIYLSLHRRNPATRRVVFDPDFNWVKVLTDERLYNAIFNTFIYVGIALILQVVLAF